MVWPCKMSSENKYTLPRHQNYNMWGQSYGIIQNNLAQPHIRWHQTKG